jgi:hypothetical protein
VIQTYEAIISENGDVELLEPVKLARARRALVTVLEDLPVSNQPRSPEVVRYSIPVGKDRSIEDSRRPYGLAAGQFVVPDDFDAPLPEEILREFEGS